jgi:phosphate-selective porin OprO/OprP
MHLSTTSLGLIIDHLQSSKRNALGTTLLLSACAAAPSARGPGVPAGDGFRLASADGRSELALGALVQVLARVSDDARDPEADFALKRVRPELSGRVAGGFTFNFEPKFSSDGDETEVELEEAWIGPALLGGRAQVHVGRMKAPFNLEEVRSRRHIDFPFFSIVNQLAPAEDLGLFWNGTSAGGGFEYGLALYNGTGGADTNASKDVALRGMVHPFAGRTASTLEHLQLGLAATFGVQEESLDGKTIDNETQLPVVRYDADARLSGSRERVGLELAWFRGPWFLQSEYLGVAEELAGDAGAEDVTLHGGYITLAHVLTGESKSFRGVVPAEPFDFATGAGRGAWVLAARYSLLNLDEALAADLVVPGSFTDQIQTGSVALNWIPNEHAILRTAVVGSFYEGDVQLDTGSGDREAALLVELQLHF